MIPAPSIKIAFQDFLLEGSKASSNKVASYLRALDLLGPILAKKAPAQLRFADVWSIADPSVVRALYEYVLDQQRKAESGIFAGKEPISYWRDGFMSAALKSYLEFLVVVLHESQLQTVLEKHASVPPGELSGILQAQEIDFVQELLPDRNIDVASKEGKDALRVTRARVNQDFFRKMILSSYGCACCLTALTVPQVLRASHISSWADDKENRLNPANGLCLSATYDAAFDRHLISLDEDHRLILSPALAEYCTNEAFNKHFKSLEGRGITLPSRYPPDAALLEKHRTAMIQKAGQ